MRKNLDTTVEWDGARVDQAWAGHQEDDSPWSTYAFEIYVYEYEDSSARVGEELDWAGLRWPYCLGIGEHNIKCHEIQSGRGLAQELKADYILIDKSYPSSQYVNPSDVQITLVNNVLQESLPSEQDPYPNALGAHNGVDGNGIVLTKIGMGDIYTDPRVFSDWRYIITGIDNCWVQYRRDHQPTRMLAYNKRYSGGRALSDTELEKLIIVLIVMMNFMSAIEYAKEVNALGARSAMEITNGEGGIYYEDTLAIQYRLRRSFVENAAQNAFLSLHTIPASKRKQITNFIVDDNESSALTYFPNESTYQIIYLSEAFKGPNTILSTTTHEFLHASHGKEKCDRFRIGDSNCILWWTLTEAICGLKYYNYINVKNAQGETVRQRIEYDYTTGEVGTGLTYKAEAEISARIYNSFMARRLEAGYVNELYKAVAILDPTTIHAFIMKWTAPGMHDDWIR